MRFFDPDFYADFNRRVEGAIDAGLENEQIADVYGLDEVDVIHGRGDNVGARVAIGGDGAGEIDEVHESAAQQVAKRVGVVGEDDLSHFRLGAGYGADYADRGFSGTHFDLLHFTACSQTFRLSEFTSATMDVAQLNAAGAPVSVSAIHANYANRTARKTTHYEHN